MTTHWRFSVENPRSLCADGNAMLTMVESRMTMSCATPTSASTAQRLGSAAGGAAADIVREYKAGSSAQRAPAGA